MKRQYKKGFAMHDQQHFRDEAADPRSGLAFWYRVTYAAYGHHGQNGHAEFGVGELRELLQIVDPKTGELKPVKAPNLSRGIDEAVKRGLLDAGSWARCLIVPAHKVWGGSTGSERARCRHERRHLDEAVKRQRGVIAPRSLSAEKLSPRDNRVITPRSLSPQSRTSEHRAIDSSHPARTHADRNPKPEPLGSCPACGQANAHEPYDCNNQPPEEYTA